MASNDASKVTKAAIDRGEGILRLAPTWLIRWGIGRLKASGRPLVVYLHPRELDPDHPHLPLSLKRQIKCYVGLKSVRGKLQWLCERCEFRTMAEATRRISQCTVPPSLVAAPAADRRPALLQKGFLA